MAACTPAGVSEDAGNDGFVDGLAEIVGDDVVGIAGGKCVEVAVGGVNGVGAGSLALVELDGHGSSGFTVTVTGPKQMSQRVPVVLAQTCGSKFGAGPIVISG